MNKSEHSFSPEINSRSRFIAKMIIPKDESLADRLNRLHNERKTKLIRAAEQKSIDELKECTFKPQVSPFIRSAHQSAVKDD